jgi:hypothetical protein
VKTKTAIISIEELGSQSVGPLGELLRAIPGVQEIDFNLERKVAVAEFDPDQTKVEELLRAILKAGYHVS